MPGNMLNLNKYSSIIEEIDPIKVYGKVTQITGLIIEGHGPGSSIGEICDIFPKGASHAVEAEVVGFKGDKIQLMPLGDTRGLSPGSKIMAKIMSEVMFKSYVQDIHKSKPFSLVLQKQSAFDGELPHNVEFTMIGDLVKWCSLKQSGCSN